MYSEGLISVDNALVNHQMITDELLFQLSKLQVTTVAIWGAGTNGKTCQLLLNQTNISITHFFDQNNGYDIHGIPVFPEPNNLTGEDCVIIAMNGPVEVIDRIRSLAKAADIPCILLLNPSMSTTDIHSTKPRLSLSQFVDKHKGRRCFVVGNGPSLNQIDMTLLKNEITFGSNRCYLGFKDWGFQFTYWSAEDIGMSGWQAEEWRQLHGITKFLPTDLTSLTDPNDPDLCLYNLNRVEFINAPPIFSIYPDCLYSGRTVTYELLQLAALMGCSPIYLIGVDFHFNLDGISKAVDKGNEEVWVCNNSKSNHFHPDYIPPNRFLHKAHWELQELAFTSANHAAKLYQFEIYNATPGSKLTVFPNVQFDDLFTPRRNTP